MLSDRIGGWRNRFGEEALTTMHDWYYKSSIKGVWDSTKYYVKRATDPEVYPFLYERFDFSKGVSSIS